MSPLLLLVLWGILGQALFPFDFNQLKQLHGGLGIYHRGMSTFTSLHVQVQQLLGEMLQKHGGILWSVTFPIVEENVGGVVGEGLGVKVLEGFEVIVDGIPTMIFTVNVFRNWL
ncbi:hypothetical protein TREES_T100020263 [Tupaia chinensis]|uniref:Uncharacterized protein n=1 Tax=Tupaia chinensis TaxID=246437 RepID=L9L7Q7_TUPCH|nr:hypothetical protein TREES_T100020263 [Tupaia chinensis]